MKDASASAINRAHTVNGVSLINTKKGRNNQKTTVELNLSKGYSNPARKRKFADARQYVELIELAELSDATYDFNNGLSGYATLDDAIADYKAFYEDNVLNVYSLGTDWKNAAVNTNWQDLLYTK